MTLDPINMLMQLLYGAPWFFLLIPTWRRAVNMPALAYKLQAGGVTLMALNTIGHWAIFLTPLRNGLGTGGGPGQIDLMHMLQLIGLIGITGLWVFAAGVWFWRPHHNPGPDA